MSKVRSSTMLWKEGGGYYTHGAEELKSQPRLPDFQRLCDRRFLSLFDRYASLTPGCSVLEIGCGESPWLPYLALQKDCSVVGVDIEPFAAELARANLEGTKTEGKVYCRDAFAREENNDLLERFDLVYSMGVVEHYDDAREPLTVLRNYLRINGRILTIVPNLRGINWIFQRLADVELLEMHVIYTPKKLTHTHEQAGFETIASGYVGFYDGFMTSVGTTTSRVRGHIHHWLCRMSNMFSAAWVQAGGGIITPELFWLSPHVFYVGKRGASVA